MSVGPEKSTLSLAILGLVALEPRSGYDLRKLFTTTPMGHFSSSPGAVYPALDRLEKAGLISGSTQKKNTLRPRRVYSITKRGRVTLNEIVTGPITRDDVIWRMDEIMLRFALMDDNTPGETLAGFLEGVIEQTEIHVKSLRDDYARLKEGMPITSKYAMEHGIAQYRSTLAWAKRVLKEVRKKVNS